MSEPFYTSLAQVRKVAGVRRTASLADGLNVPAEKATNRTTNRLAPARSPSPTCENEREKIASTIRRRFAPSATRTPISRVRRDTVNDMTE